MTYQDAVAVLPKEDRDRATMYAMNNLLQRKGLYTKHEFEVRFIDWTRSHYRGYQLGHADFVTDLVAKHYGLQRMSLREKCNESKVVVPRQIAMYLMRALTDWSLPQIGRYYCKHHTTVFHSIGVIAARREADAEVNSLIASTSETFHKQFSEAPQD